MKKVMVVLMVVMNGSLFGQGDVWVRDHDTVTEKSGYRDLKGRVMLPQKFVGMPPADSFHNIIAVMEEINGKYSSYYLLKNGKKVGVDSVYMFDYQYDCENEEKILFYDKKGDKVGFFNKDGQVVVPALYNTATPFRNGLSFALQHAKRKCAGEEGHQDCEHWTWNGGELKLINDKNEVLIDRINYMTDDLDLFSMKVNAAGLDTSLYVSFTGKNGDVYSFIDVRKEFQHWFNSEFVPSIRSANQRWNDYVFDRVYLTLPGLQDGVVQKTAFLSKMKNQMPALNFSEDSLTCLTLSKEWHAPFFENEFSFAGYTNGCGVLDINRYPLFEATLTRYKKRSAPIKPLKPTEDIYYLKHEPVSDQKYGFIRTEKGFRLYTVSHR